VLWGNHRVGLNQQPRKVSTSDQAYLCHAASARWHPNPEILWHCRTLCDIKQQEWQIKMHYPVIKCTELKSYGIKLSISPQVHIADLFWDLSVKILLLYSLLSYFCFTFASLFWLNVSNSKAPVVWSWVLKTSLPPRQLYWALICENIFSVGRVKVDSAWLFITLIE